MTSLGAAYVLLRYYQATQATQVKGFLFQSIYPYKKAIGRCGLDC